MSFVPLGLAQQAPVKQAVAASVASNQLPPTKVLADMGDAFSNTIMRVVKLKGMTLRIGEPIQVAAQLAWQEGPQGRWAMNHPTPTIARFPSGELLVTYTQVSDGMDNPRDLSAIHFSEDGGKTWGEKNDLIPQHQAMIYVPTGPSALMAIPAYLKSDGDPQNFYANYTLLERGGRRIVIEPRGVKVVDWPWPVARNNWYYFFPGDVPGTFPRRLYFHLYFDGNALEVDGGLIATGYAMKEGDTMFQSIVMRSEDKGRTWKYLSTVADASGLPWDAEGPNEITMIKLADGDLMSVHRVAALQNYEGRKWFLRRAFSSDGGRSWTKPESLPAHSVEPRLLQIKNGLTLLSTGRPGVHLWLTDNPKGDTWQDVDLVKLHNEWASDPTYKIRNIDGLPWSSWQTTGYTAMVEISPNRVLLVYDRSAKPWPQNNNDLTRIFVVPIQVDRE